MADEPPEIESRRDRLAAYLRYNSERMLVDLLVLFAWIVAASAIFGLLNLPRWLLYVVLFAGVVIYSRLTSPWARPYRSPDLEE